jgi:hypothetical protein
MVLIKTFSLLSITIEAIDLDITQLIYLKLLTKEKQLNANKRFNKQTFNLYAVQILKTILKEEKTYLLQKIKCYKIFFEKNKKKSLNWETAENYYSFTQYLKKFAYYSQKKGGENTNYLDAIKGLLLLEIFLNSI